ncbi:hypothetical protein [Duganella sp. FT27W]|uniref:Acb2/Tad1 domain-containing protein n=1 Tax=Duganella sp. FT27W TaxID=2654636 RepID=UPI00128D673C|nr:hypothetical protein [Duganella sp. FT27W]MPQ56288.1 hypothetical protein [Duganella sp. FT27W]
MDNQHRKIAGYNEFDAETIDLMNQVRQHNHEIAKLVEMVKQRIATQRTAAIGDADLTRRMNAAEPERWAALGRTSIQQGLMFLTRAVAQPEF